MSSAVFRNLQAHSLSYSLVSPFKLLPTDFCEVATFPPLCCCILQRWTPAGMASTSTSEDLPEPCGCSHCILHRNGKNVLLNSLQYCVICMCRESFQASCQTILVASQKSVLISAPAEEWPYVHLPTHHLFLLNTRISLTPHPPQIPLSAKINRPENAVMHGNGNPGGGMKGCKPGTSNPYVVGYTVMWHKEIAFSKRWYLLVVSLIKAKYPPVTRHTPIVCL